MVAFRCPCGNSTTGTDELLSGPAEKDGYVYVVCSEECYQKYKDGPIV